WRVNTYNVTLHKNVGDTTSAVKTIAYNIAEGKTAKEVIATILAEDNDTTFERAGYALVGWAASEDAASDEVITNLGTWLLTATNLDLYAVWSTNKDTAYSVSYYLQDVTEDAYGYKLVYNTVADGTKAEGLSDETGKLIEISDSDARTYFTIPAGYVYDTDKNEGAVINGEGTTNIKVYYKRASYAVSFDLNKEEGTTGNINVVSLPNITVTYGLPYGYHETLTTITRVGYKFNGWTVEGGEFVTIDTIYNLTEGSTLYASWTADETTYLVEHYIENVLNDEFTKVETEDIKDTTDKVVSAVIKTMTGFTYIANYELEKISGQNSADAQLVLKVYYSRNTIDVDFVVEGEVKHSETIKYEETIEIDSVITEEPQKDGYTFVGWVDANKPTEFITSVEAGTEDIEIKAVFEENEYTFIFNTNIPTATQTFGKVYTFSDGRKTAKYTKTLNLSEAASGMNRTGYTLVGFSYSADTLPGDTEYKTSDSNFNAVPVETLVKNAPGATPPYKTLNINLYAIWQIDTFKVTYKNDTVVGGEETYE
ncbi:MAG: InlB B-repeat-containing protein, partial [Clostridia bacterium]|nr:InlB B-repeat-containing protein [Clostridia bacterium]